MWDSKAAAASSEFSATMTMRIFRSKLLDLGRNGRAFPAGQTKPC